MSSESMIEIPHMSNVSKNVLDIWLKFGTAFIVYRIGMFYATKQQGELFDQTFLQILLFTLIGFSLYYVMVKPFVTDKIEHPMMRGLTDDFLFFGGGIAVSQLLYNYVNDIDSSAIEMESIGSLLVALAIYRIAIHPFVPSVGMNQLAYNDIVKFGSILIIYQLVSTMDVGSITNTNFLISLAMVLLGFLAYHYGTKKLINN